MPSVICFGHPQSRSWGSHSLLCSFNPFPCCLLWIWCVCIVAFVLVWLPLRVSNYYVVCTYTQYIHKTKTVSENVTYSSWKHCFLFSIFLFQFQPTQLFLWTIVSHYHHARGYLKLENTQWHIFLEHQFYSKVQGETHFPITTCMDAFWNLTWNCKNICS